MPRQPSTSSMSSSDTESEILDRKGKKRSLENSTDSEVESDDEQHQAVATDEQVLSHKERRKQKKEAKRAEKGPSTKKRKLEDGSAIASNTKDEPAKRQNSVWVGNLSFKTQQDNLREFFKSAGEITRIHMPTKISTVKGMKPENQGYAYVDFATVETKTAAISLSEQPLLGRKLLIKDGSSFEGRPAVVIGPEVIKDPEVAQKTHTKTAQKILRTQKQPPSPTLFLGNLSFDTTEEAIRELLDAHRPSEKKKAVLNEDVKGAQGEQEKWIRKIRMGTFEDSGKCKGFAFVDFSSIDNATAALIHPRNHQLNGRNLIVEYASVEAVRRGASKDLVAAPKFKRRPLSAGYKKTRGRKVENTETEGAISPSKDSVTQTATTNGVSSSMRRPKKERESAPLPAANEWTERSFNHKGPKYRPRPGAALAQAKRETAAIVPSQGKKIVF